MSDNDDLISGLIAAGIIVAVGVGIYKVLKSFGHFENGEEISESNISSSNTEYDISIFDRWGDKVGHVIKGTIFDRWNDKIGSISEGDIADRWNDKVGSLSNGTIYDHWNDKVGSFRNGVVFDRWSDEIATYSGSDSGGPAGAFLLIINADDDD